MYRIILPLHRSLHGSTYNSKFAEYYENIKDRLIPVNGSSYEYSFTDEDFYIYMISHEHKHYSIGGTGLRSLLDVFVYLSAKENKMDFEYVRKECETLGIAEFEREGRLLCKKVFSKEFAEALVNNTFSLLTDEEKARLDYYLTSGAYGTISRASENKIAKYQKETGSASKARYLWSRLFPDMETVKLYFPFFYRHKWLMPVLWIYRPIRALLSKKRRKTIAGEIKAIRLRDAKRQ